MTQEEQQTATRNKYFRSILREIESWERAYELGKGPFHCQLERLGPLGLIEILAREYVGNSDFNREKLMEVLGEL